MQLGCTQSCGVLTRIMNSRFRGLAGSGTCTTTNSHGWRREWRQLRGVEKEGRNGRRSKHGWNHERGRRRHIRQRNVTWLQIEEIVTQLGNGGRQSGNGLVILGVVHDTGPSATLRTTPFYRESSTAEYEFVEGFFSGCFRSRSRGVLYESALLFRDEAYGTNLSILVEVIPETF